MEALFSFVKTVLGLMTALLVWFGIQAFVRRRSGCSSQKDVLDFMKNGCAGCKGNGACHNRGKEKEHHELA
jgi:hypothetical protein